MKRKILASLIAGATLLSLAGCGIEVKLPRQPDIKVTVADHSTIAHIYFRNDYQFSDSSITKNEDGTYTVIITAIPPENLTSN